MPPLLPLQLLLPKLLPLVLLPLVTSHEPGRNAMPDTFGPFLSWLQQGADDAGFALDFPDLAGSFELRLGRFGQTLYSTRRFERGETIAIVPLSHLLSELNYSAVGTGDIRSNLKLHLARQRRGDFY